MVALLPAMIVVYILLDKVMQQSRNEILKGLEHNTELHAELIERELSTQLTLLKQLSQITDIKQSPTSALFSFQAGLHLQSFIKQSPTVAACFILDMEHWPVETVPLSAELIDLNMIISKVEPFLTATQKVLAEQAQPENVTPYLFSIRSQNMVSKLLENSEQINSDWVLVMVYPLIQNPRQAKVQFKVVGSLLVLEPYQNFGSLLEKWKPVNGQVELFQAENQYYQSISQTEVQGGSELISWESSIELEDQEWSLKISMPPKTLLAVVLEDHWQLTLIVSSILLFSSFIALSFTQKVKQQLIKLLTQVKAFARGEYEYQVSNLQFTELKQVSSVLEQLSEKVITDQTHLEIKVQERTLALSQSNEKLNQTLDNLKDTQHKLIESEKMASLGQLVSGVAHELNTPLGICITAMGLMKENNRSIMNMIESGAMKKTELIQLLSEQKEANDLMESNIQRSNQLIALFKELSIHSEVDTIAQFDLKQLIKDTAEIWKIAHQQHKVEVNIICEQLLINTYMEALRRVITLLFDNAATHAIKDRTDAKITISCLKVAGGIELKFRDDGKGVSIEPVSRIFEPFYTSTRHSGNVGLGLHLAYNLVTQRLEGCIDARNHPQGGLEIKLKLHSLAS